MATVLNSPAVVEEDQVFELWNIGWDQYVAINDILSERAGLRMIYLDGSLTLVSPTRRHEWHSDLFDSIVKAVATGCGIRWEVAGSATFREEAKLAGIEPDRTYYFAEHAALMGGPIDIDLTTLPPPDLVVEVEYTNPATKALVVYDRLGVPEVWRFHVKRNALTFLHRRHEGGYEGAPTSKHLPMLTPEDVLGQVRLAEQLASSTDWTRQLAGWVQDVILPRVGQDR